MASYRLLRLANRIRFLVSAIIQREIADPRLGMVTVLKVDVSPDVKEAKVFISIFGPSSDRSKTIRALEDARGFIQKEVGKNLETRSTPRLRFVLDESGDKVSRIEALVGEGTEEPEDAMAKKTGKKDAKASKSTQKPSAARRKDGSKSAGRKGSRVQENAVQTPKAPKVEKLKNKPTRKPMRPRDEEEFEQPGIADEEKEFVDEFEAEPVEEEDLDEDEDEDDYDEDEEEEEEEEDDEEY